MNEILKENAKKIWTEHDAKRNIVTKILELAKNNQLSIEQRNILFEIIKNSNRTEKQKDRFIKFYNLSINQKYNYTLSALAQECGCKPAAIKFSLDPVITHTLLHNDENMEILKKMIEA